MLALALPFLGLAAGCETFLAAEAVKDHPVKGRLVDVGGGRKTRSTAAATAAPLSCSSPEGHAGMPG
jgi:hypothetical protein